MYSAATAIVIAMLTPPMATTPDVRACVKDGLKWLADQQKTDGGWTGANNGNQTTITATAGLALLMEGSTPKEGTYSPNIRKAVAWVEKNSSATGLLTSTADLQVSQSVATHATALLFLACAYDVDEDEDRRERLAKLLKKAVAFAVKRQTSRGGWGYINAAPGNEFDDSQTTATVLQALLAARKVGIDVPKTSTDKAIAYLVALTDIDGGVSYNVARGARPIRGNGQPLISATAASGLLMHDGLRPESLPKWVKFAAANNESSLRSLRDGTGGSFAFQQQYHLARTMFALGEGGHQRLAPEARETALRWSTLRQPLFKALKETQKPDGSWADLYVGPAYTTAVALVILQLDNGYLPALAR